MNESNKTPPICHVVWTPTVTRVWTHSVNIELLNEILDITEKLYFDQSVAVSQLKKQLQFYPESL